mmetsp:Transcript_29504/g.73056  ORF Transcript_29504/g.73056 Transcript_29504/m.73056 type:complete len:253 (+) Transcript_29504:2061-2819(+)
MMCLCAPILPLATMAPSASTAMRSAMRLVMSDTSYGGLTSTISIPHSPSLATSPTSLSASRGSRPPGSGHPVPGTNAASRLSMSYDRYTASAPSHARSSAISATLGMPSSSTSSMVKMLVRRPTMCCTALRGTCQPPMPICTRLVAGTLGRLVAWKYGVVCMRSSRSFSWMSACRSTWMMPIFLVVHAAMPRMVGKPMEWSPPRMSGKEPEENTWPTALEIWSKDFSMLAGMVNTSPASHSVICSRRSMPIS